ncbi:MAG TPA: DNA polymerase Y family protein [Candidatus Sulfotelmatobacter sp.]|nr:DNA polymerase Y family protein [Candidatus Sulfotelmatobacter sp.]
MVFACIFIPDFPVQAITRQEPDLRSKPVAVLQGAAPLTKVFAANPAARDRGVELGMTKLQAESCGPLEWRWRSLAQEASAQAALLDCAWTISPLIEQPRKGSAIDFCDSVVLDLAGCEKLFGSPEQIAHHLQRIAAAAGLEANVAFAGNPEAALSAARGFPGITLIPPGEEAAILGALPLSSLGLPAEMLETLHRWGIRTYSEFAALPEIAVIERFGQEGKRWHQLSHGGDPKPLLPKQFPDRFEESMDLEFSVDLLEPLLFVLNRLLDQLCLRLRMHLLATTELKITLTLDPKILCDQSPLPGSDESVSQAPEAQDAGFVRTGGAACCAPTNGLHIRNLRLPVPVNESKFLLKLLQLDLQAHPPGAPVTAIHIQAIPTRPRTRQMGLFLPLAPEPEALEITLARIQGVVGEGRAGAPVLLDSHRPNAFRQQRFVLPEASLTCPPAEHPPQAALRLYRPPLPATVQLQHDQPHTIYFNHARQPILAFAGPSRSTGEWWSETPWARDEWDVLLPLPRPQYQSNHPFHDNSHKPQETALYRIYRDLLSNHWFVEGIYD